MTPEQVKKQLDYHIKLVEIGIGSVEELAHTVGRHYGVYGIGDPTNVYDTLKRLRALQEQLLTDTGKAEFLANVHTLAEQGRL